MIQLGVSVLTRLLKAVVDRSHAFDDGKGSLPSGKKLVGGVKDVYEDTISYLELLRLGSSVIKGLLPLLGSGQVFLCCG